MKTIVKWTCVVFALGCVSESGYAREQITHQLGPTGLHGTIENAVVTISRVDKGSPADGKIKAGDQLAGVGTDPFKGDVRRELAAAIDLAETQTGGGTLRLMLKEGKPVDLQLNVLGDYSATSPYDCPKSTAIIERAAEHLVKHGKIDAGYLHPGLLGLMATGEKKYIDLVAKVIQEADWAKPNQDDIMAVLGGDKDMGYVSWSWSYNLITLAEYHLLTGDASVLPAIRLYATALALGQDAGGIWGHRMATKKRNGRLPGYAQINQPSLTCFMGMLLAQKCGVEDEALNRGIEKTYAFYASFIEKGAFNYGVHGPNTQNFNNNGTSGSAALCMSLKGNSKGARFFSQLAATSYDGLETGHASAFFNPFWTPLGANLSGPEVTQQFFKKSLWLQTLYRSWDGGFTYNGQNAKEGYQSGVALLAYCVPRKVLYITGKNADESIWLKGADAPAAINRSKVDYTSKSNDELIADFGHFIPHVSRAAVWTLRERKGDFIPKLVSLMKNGTTPEKVSALGYFGYQCPPDVAMPQLVTMGNILRDTNEDPQVRATAAGSLAWLGEAAYPYYRDMLGMVMADEPGDTFKDIDESLGASLNQLCKEPFAAGLVTDKDLFYKAALKLVDHKRQNVRADGLRMLAGLPLEDFHLVADKVMHVIHDQDPTYHSYHSASGPIGAGITILANLNIEEGMQHTVDVLDTDSGKWGFKVRMVNEVLPKYGANAKPFLEKLRADARLKTIEQDRFGAGWRSMVKAIEEDPSPKKLITLEEAKRAGHR